MIQQLLLPLALLAWLGLAPLPGRLGFIVQVLATAAALLALHLVGLWLVPPWWAPWLYWIVLIILVVRATRFSRSRVVPRRTWHWIATALLAALGLYAGWIAIDALRGRQPPSQSTVQLRLPLEPGRYLVANGGTTAAISSHARTFARATPMQREYFGQSHGVDLVEIDRFGLQADGFSPRDPARYHIFGAKVLAPCSGRVLIAHDGVRDMPVPQMDRENIPGNHILLRCGGADILLAHFRRDSLVVEAGQTVREGQVLGEVGNSGNSSMPHLHVHAQMPGEEGAPFSGRPLPIRIGGRYLVRGDRLRKDAGI